MRLAIASPGGPGDVAVEHGDVIRVDAQQLQSGVSAPPAMSAAIASRRRPSRTASAMRVWSSTSSTRSAPMLRAGAYRGRTKTAYALATRRCLQWRRDPGLVSDNTAPPDPGSPAHGRRPARRPRGDRGSRRPPVAGVLAVALAARIHHPRPSQCRPRGHARLRRRHSGCRQGSTRRSSVPCARPRQRTPGSSSWSRTAGAPGPTRKSSSARRSRSTARKRRLPVGGRAQHVRSRVLGRGRPRVLRCRVAFRIRRPVRACAGSTATSPGTTNCARTPPFTAARPCTPTPPTIKDAATHSKPRRARAGRAHQRGLWLGRALQGQHRQQHRPPPPPRSSPSRRRR